MVISECPKCGYKRLPQDAQVLPGICPACGIAYQKWLDRLRIESSEASDPDNTVQTHVYRPVAVRVRERLFSVPDQIDGLVLYGRLSLYLFFFVWGWLFIVDGIDWEGIGGSFLHNINLPFHEFGHVLFSPLVALCRSLGVACFRF